MGPTAAFHMIIDIEVTDASRFRQLAAEASTISLEEPGTLNYDWYLDEQTGRARLHEAYASFEALDAHGAGRVFTEIAPQFFETCRFVHIDFLGDMPEERRQAPPLAPRTIWGSPFASGTTSTT